MSFSVEAFFNTDFSDVIVDDLGLRAKTNASF